MKRFFWLFTAILMLSLLSVTASADSLWEYEDYIHGDTTGVAITAYLGDETDLYIPAEIDGKQVLKIGGEAFKDNDTLNSVTLSQNIKVIGESAFYDSDNLVCIVTNDVLEVIEANAFGSCDKFNSVILLDNVTEIADTAFAGCNALTIYCNENNNGYNHAVANTIPYVIISEDATPEIYTLDGIEYFIMNGEAYAVSFDGSFTEVVIPATVEGYPVVSITVAFENKKISSIQLPDTIKAIDDYAFYNTYIKSISIPDSVVSIGDYAFSGCKYLSDVEFGASLETIGNYAFSGCFKTVVFNDALKEIGDSAFSLSSITKIVFGKSLETIGKEAFCLTNIEEIHFGDSVKSIGDKAFNFCYKLKTISFGSCSPQIGANAFDSYSVISEVNLFDISAWCNSSFATPQSNPIYFSHSFNFRGDEISDLTIPESIKAVPSYAFINADNIQRVVLSDGVESIKKSAFLYCDKIETMIISDTLSEIYTSSFDKRTVLVVKKDSYAHQFALANERFYFITDGKNMPEFYTVNNVVYAILEEIAVPVYYNGGKNSVVVVSNVEGYPVSRLTTAFRETDITGIVLPDTISSIPDNAFFLCDDLLSIVIPSSVKTIGHYAFWYSSLTEVNIPEGVTFIGDYAFYYTEITSLTLSDTVEHIGQYAFTGCNCLTDLIIPDSVTEIGIYAFDNCYRLESIKISTGITCIEEYTFSRCSSLVSVTIPSNVKTIDDYAFKGCSKLQNFVLSEGIEELGRNIIEGCTSLTELVFPSTIIKCYSIISDSLRKVTVKCSSALYFSNCPNLESVILCEGVQRIASGAFNKCSKLNPVVVPSTVTVMYVDSFSEFTILVVNENTYAHSFAKENSLLFYVSVDGEYPEMYYCDGGMYYISDESAILLSVLETTTDIIIPSEIKGYPVVSIGTAFKNSTVVSVVIPDTITEICQQSFLNATKLKSISLPDTLKVIGVAAFRGCVSLESIEFPAGLIKIESYAFANADSLKRVVLPSSISEVGSHAFAGCNILEDVVWSSNAISIPNYCFYNNVSLKSITIPENITYIGERCFCGCSLTEINLPSTLQNMGIAVFSDCENLITVRFSEGIEIIPYYAFDGCKSIETVYIPSTLKEIKEDAFRDTRNPNTVYITNLETWCKLETSDSAFCAKNLYLNGSLLETVVIPEGITSLKTGVFCANESIKSISIPDSVAKIETNAISYCTALERLVIPESVTNIANTAFAGCSSLENVTINAPLTIISSEMFSNCTKLRSVNIPGTVTVIAKNAFNCCYSLESIILPSSLTSIEDKAFYGCSGLQGVDIPDSVVAIGASAFKNCKNIKQVYIPSSVTSMSVNSFPSTTILLVEENSYAHTFAKDNNLLYFVLHKTANPEINYGTGISGTVEYTDGTPAAGVNVEILYNDGTVKETVVTDENGAYAFTYAEVGRYSIRATDTNSNTATELVSVKRMNVFDVFLEGDTELILKKGYKLYGTTSASATVIVTDTDGNVIATAETEGNAFSFADVPNGTYIVNAGGVTKEIHIYRADCNAGNFELPTESATITGEVEIENRDETRTKKIWINVTLYNSEGNAVAQTKTDADGKYTFTNITPDTYAIVAETEEMRPDKDKHFDRPHKLTGYASVEVTENITYTAETIVLYEENDHTATISGKVTANGETQDCEVILANVFRHEIAKYTTKKNGKYSFTNVQDGLYFITAITNSDGMGFTVVLVRHGHVYGETDIRVLKGSNITYHEGRMKEIPHCSNRDEALQHKDRIREEKDFYDSLPEKEKKQFSKEYIERLNRLCEYISNSEWETPDGVDVDRGGTLISGEELEKEEAVEFVLDITKTEECEIDENGIDSKEKHKQQKIKDNSKDKNIVEYYDITLTKNGKAITNVQKHTETSGKLRITMEIPEEYRGHKHYSFIHEHNGTVTTLTDLDDDPNTVTFEVDKFSTFALAYTDTELTQEVEDTALTAVGTSLVLDGSIGVKTYFEATEGVVVTTVIRDTVLDTDIMEESSALVFDEEKQLWYTVTYIAPKDADNYAVRHKVGDTESEEISIMSYIAAFKTMAESNDEYRTVLALVNALENYLKYADNYFSDADALEEVELTKEINVNSAEKTGTLTGIEFYATSLILEDRTTIRHYFKVTDEAAVNTFKVGDTELQVNRKGSDLIYVDIEDIAAHELDRVYTLNVSDTFTVKYSAINYIQKVIETQTDIKLINLAKALYNYYVEADAYHGILIPDDDESTPSEW